MPTFGAWFLVLHGLITAFIGLGHITRPSAPALVSPSWMTWWPGPFGRSWLLEGLHAGSDAVVASGLLWLGAGAALLAAGFGWLGVAGLADAWQRLAVTGGALGLAAAMIYFHPFYLLAVAINVLIIAMVWGRLAPA